MRHPPQNGSSQTLTAIYAALALGVFLFAAVVLFVLEPMETSVDGNIMRFVWLGLAAVATLAVGIVRGRLAGAGADQTRMAAIVVWALAEGQALVGITGTMLTGDRVIAYAALALFVWLWMRYPPRAFSGG